MFHNQVSGRIVFTSFVFTDVPTEPEFLSGGGCYIYSSPTDSTQLGSVKTKTKAYAPLRLLLRAAGILSLCYAFLSESLEQDNSQQQCIYIHPGLDTWARVHTHTHTGGSECGYIRENVRERGWVSVRMAGYGPVCECVHARRHVRKTQITLVAV